MNQLSIGDVVETDFSGTKTVHTVVDEWGDYVRIRPPMPGCPERWQWFKSRFTKVGVEVREIEPEGAD